MHSVVKEKGMGLKTGIRSDSLKDRREGWDGGGATASSPPAQSSVYRHTLKLVVVLQNG